MAAVACLLIRAAAAAVFVVGCPAGITVPQSFPALAPTFEASYIPGF